MKKILTLVLILFSTSAFSDDNDFFEVGVGFTSYGTYGRHQSLDDFYMVSVRWGTLFDTGTYLWATYERPELKVLGQGFAKLNTPGVGVGVRIPFRDRLNGFAEFGMYFPKAKERSPEVTEEVIREVLTEDFGDGPYADQILDYYDAWSFNYEKGLGGRAGITYDLTKRMVLVVDYRFLRFEQGFDLWNSGGTGEYPEDVNNCNPNNNYVGGCLWQERDQADLSGVTFSLSFRF